MAIREHFRRALRSDASATQADNQTAGKLTTAMTTSSATSDKSTSSKASSLASKLSRSWTWGSNKEQISAGKPKKSKRRITHPSEKPLTRQNMEHQEMLSQFTWTFGTSRPEQIEGDDFSGISPCCTRAPSVVNFSLDNCDDSDSSSPSSSSVSVNSS